MNCYGISSAYIVYNQSKLSFIKGQWQLACECRSARIVYLDRAKEGPGYELS